MQDEEQLEHAVQTLSLYFEQYESVMARLSQKLNRSSREVEAHQSSQPQPLSPSTTNMEVSTPRPDMRRAQPSENSPGGQGWIRIPFRLRQMMAAAVCVG